MSPRQVFDVSFHIAESLVHLYRLFEDEGVRTEEQIVASLRRLLNTGEADKILVLQNSVFLGCVLEKANVPDSTFHPQALQNLLRQAIVSSCTAYETFLSASLQQHLDAVIELRQHEFFPNDPQVSEYFSDLSFSMGDAFVLLKKDPRERAVFLGQKIVTHVQRKNLGSLAGLKTVGLLLGIEDPWGKLAAHLGQAKRDLTSPVQVALERRHSIVHRSDRDLTAEDFQRNLITFAQTSLAVNTIKFVCLGFDELVTARMVQHRAELAARQQENPHV
jgi:hypothetical protein